MPSGQEHNASYASILCTNPQRALPTILTPSASEDPYGDADGRDEYDSLMRAAFDWRKPGGIICVDVTDNINFSPACYTAIRRPLFPVIGKPSWNLPGL